MLRSGKPVLNCVSAMGRAGSGRLPGVSFARTVPVNAAGKPARKTTIRRLDRNTAIAPARQKYTPLVNRTSAGSGLGQAGFPRSIVTAAEVPEYGTFGSRRFSSSYKNFRHETWARSRPPLYASAIASGTSASASTTFARFSAVRAFISCSWATARARRSSARARATRTSASA